PQELHPIFPESKSRILPDFQQYRPTREYKSVLANHIDSILAAPVLWTRIYLHPYFLPSSIRGVAPSSLQLVLFCHYAWKAILPASSLSPPVRPGYTQISSYLLFL